MLRFLRARLRQPPHPARLPADPAELPERFRGRLIFEPGRCEEGCRQCRESLPSPLLVDRGDGTVGLDLGACLFSPEEHECCPHGALRYSRDYRLAASTREELVTGGGEAALARALERKSRRLFGRSLRLRSVAAGSCNGCESELVALGNVVFDMARFGIQFVASPRHADGIVVTGALSLNMRDALYRTWEATPAPRLLIAVGACAINGGPFRGSAEVGNGVPDDLPVDLWVPGCPPHPLTLLDGLLRMLGRLESDGV